MAAMTKNEREELMRLLKGRAKVAKAAATQRSASLLSEFEKQISAIYSFDQDEVWKAVATAAKAEIDRANEAISKRCDELGIMEEFKPSLSLAWNRRGQSEMLERRTELRRAAKAEIDNLEKMAVARIEAESVQAQTNLLSQTLTSETAIAFLNSLPTVESLMPQVEFKAIEAKLEEKARKRLGYYRDYD